MIDVFVRDDRPFLYAHLSKEWVILALTAGVDRSESIYLLDHELSIGCKLDRFSPFHPLVKVRFHSYSFRHRDYV